MIIILYDESIFRDSPARQQIREGLSQQTVGVPDMGGRKLSRLQDIPDLKHAIDSVCGVLSRAGFPPGRYRYGPGQHLDPGYARKNGLTFSMPVATLVHPCTSRKNEKFVFFSVFSVAVVYLRPGGFAQY
ncbi:MAG: hypothetical protein KJO66_05870 [Gammaproteobacteria bacterium]|nr:hypothetical protein [Gammaproteobacteria bacterium]